MSATLPGSYAPKITGSSGFATRDFAAAPALGSLDFPEEHIAKMVGVGHRVLWYANCNPSSKPIAVDVVAVGHRYVTLGSWQQFNGADRNVRFRGDPLCLNPAERVNGCWDFTAEWYQQRQLEEELQQARAALKNALGMIGHYAACVKQLAAKLGEELPEFAGAVEEAPAAEPEKPELTEAELRKQQADLMAALGQDAGELETENVSLPASERVEMRHSRRQRQTA